VLSSILPPPPMASSILQPSPLAANSLRSEGRTKSSDKFSLFEQKAKQKRPQKAKNDDDYDIMKPKSIKKESARSIKEDLSLAPSIVLSSRSYIEQGDEYPTDYRENEEVEGKQEELPEEYDIQLTSFTSLTDIISSQNGNGYWTITTVMDMLSVSKEELLKQHPERKNFEDETESKIYQNCWATLLVLAYLKLKFADKSTILETIIVKSAAYLALHNLTVDKWNEEAKNVVQKYLSI